MSQSLICIIEFPFIQNGFVPLFLLLLIIVNIQHDPVGGERRPIFDVLGVRRESESVLTVRVDVQLEFAVVLAHTLAEHERVFDIDDRIV